MPGQLTEEQEMELLRQYKSGDTTAYRKLRLSLRPLIERVIADTIPSGNSVASSSLRMKADVELPKILQNFDESREIKLKTYVYTLLKGYLRNTVSENMSGPYVPRNQHPDLERYNQAIRDAEMNFGRNPTEEQIRSFYPEDEATNSFDKIKQYHVNSYLGDAVFNEDAEGTGVEFKDQFSDGGTITNDDLLSSLYEEEQNELIQQTFNPQEQQVIDKVTKEGLPFVQVALSLGIGTSDVRKIMRRWHEVTQKNH